MCRVAIFVLMFSSVPRTKTRNLSCVPLFSPPTKYKRVHIFNNSSGSNSAMWSLIKCEWVNPTGSRLLSLSTRYIYMYPPFLLQIHAQATHAQWLVLFLRSSNKTKQQQHKHRLQFYDEYCIYIISCMPGKTFFLTVILQHFIRTKV